MQNYVIKWLFYVQTHAKQAGGPKNPIGVNVAWECAHGFQIPFRLKGIWWYDMKGIWSWKEYEAVWPDVMMMFIVKPDS